MCQLAVRIQRSISLRYITKWSFRTFSSNHTCYVKRDLKSIMCSTQPCCNWVYSYRSSVTTISQSITSQPRALWAKTLCISMPSPPVWEGVALQFKASYLVPASMTWSHYNNCRLPIYYHYYIATAHNISHEKCIIVINDRRALYNIIVSCLLHVFRQQCRTHSLLHALHIQSTLL